MQVKLLLGSLIRQLDDTFGYHCQYHYIGAIVFAYILI